MKTEYYNIRKLSLILWGMDITDGENESTVYARKRSDLTRHAKMHGYIKRD